MAALAVAGACSTNSRRLLLHWRTDFESGEKSAEQDGRDLFIYYENTRPGVHDDLRDLLESDELRLALRPYVCCRLFRSHEPDRRFVAQYGVERAPAVIVIHRDATYHALTGRRSADEIVDFLERAQSPGATPVYDPLLPRRAEANWQHNGGLFQWEKPDPNKSDLLVYERRFSDDWKRMRALLDRPELREHLRHRNLRRMTIGWPWTDRVDTPYGELSPPAVVVIDADGSHHIVERPDAVASLSSALLGVGAPSHGSSAPAPLGSSP